MKLSEPPLAPLCARYLCRDIIVEDKFKESDPEPYWRASISAADLREFFIRFAEFIEEEIG